MYTVNLYRSVLDIGVAEPIKTFEDVLSISCKDINIVLKWEYSAIIISEDFGIEIIEQVVENK